MKTKRSKNLTLYLALLLFVLSMSGEITAQVTIGSDNEPNQGALLDLKEEQKADGSANSTKGLGLPRVALNSLITLAGDNHDLKTTIDNTSGMIWNKTEHIGLVVYNMAERTGRDGSSICPGVYVWEGTTWIRLFEPCAKPGDEITTLTCGTHSMNVVKGEAVTTGNTFAIPYSGKTGADIVLTDNQPLGAVTNDMIVQADGDQILSTAGGTINIKVTGTPTITGNFTLSYTIGGKACTIGVTSADPCVAPQITTHPIGETPLVDKGGKITPIFIAAVGDNLTYQWYKSLDETPRKWTAIVGATNPILTPFSDELGVFFYRCHVSNDCGSTVESSECKVVVGCGAYIAPNNWRTFMCYNLGVVETADPLIPSKELHGDWYQWGRSTIAAFGPNHSTQPDVINGTWNNIDAPNNSWTNTNPMPNNPCPTGWRIPNSSEWTGVINNNTHTAPAETSWTNSNTNFKGGWKFGEYLYLPAAGLRKSSTGELESRGIVGLYWSVTEAHTTANYLRLNSTGPQPNNASRRFGFSVRCMEE